MRVEVAKSLWNFPAIVMKLWQFDRDLSGGLGWTVKLSMRSD
jgi:hypothetical protein